MLRVAYDTTSLAESPHGGIARVCYHTVRQASSHDDVLPVACYKSGDPANLADLDVTTIRVHPLSGILSPKFDIAHSLCHRTLKVRAKKNIYLVHDTWSLKPNPYQSSGFQRKLGKRLRDDILKADFVVTDSETTRKNLLAFDLIAPDQCRAIRLGYEPSSDTNTEPSDPAIGSLTDQTFVLFVGCLEVRKNLGHVLDAVRSIDNIHLVLAGSPGYGYGDQIKPKLAEFPSARLHHLNAANHSDLDLLYRHALATLLPSWEEGFGLPIVEAMANGCPVITSNRSANAEIGGDAAILVDPENPAESKQAIERLLESTSYREGIIESGRQRSQQFTWEKYFDRLVKVYRQVLSS